MMNISRLESQSCSGLTTLMEMMYRYDSARTSRSCFLPGSWAGSLPVMTICDSRTTMAMQHVWPKGWHHVIQRQHNDLQHQHKGQLDYHWNDQKCRPHDVDPGYSHGSYDWNWCHNSCHFSYANKLRLRRLIPQTSNFLLVIFFRMKSVTTSVDLISFSASATFPNTNRKINSTTTLWWDYWTRPYINEVRDSIRKEKEKRHGHYYDQQRYWVNLILKK